MELFGNIVIYIIMFCAVIGAVSSIINEKSELGAQFLEGFNAIGSIFLPVAGVMASAPFLVKIISKVFGPVFTFFGADPAMAATTFIAVDMGGYQLADALAHTRESWIMAMVTGYMAGATIVFNVPVALKILQVEDRKYLALGMMAGFISIPFGVLISSLVIAFSNPMIRESISTNAQLSYQMALGFGQIFQNLIPLIIMCAILAIGLFFFPDRMIKIVNIFGKILDSALRIIVVLCIIEYFTGLFSKLFGHWGFDPIIADTSDINRALEISGAIGLMLCGAFPMVYLIKKYLGKPLKFIGEKIGLSEDTTTGILACAANALALFPIIKDMKPEDKVRTLSFTVCGAFLIGDHLAFTANYQPSLILPIMFGKLAAAILSIFIANKFIIPRVLKRVGDTQ